MDRFSGAVLLFALFVSNVSAQPISGDVQPNRLVMGTVYTGAIVEASFMVFESGKNANIRLDVVAPKFVKVLNKATHNQQYGPGNDFVSGSVEIAIDSAAAGAHNGDITVTLGKTTATVPVSVTVKPRQPGLSRLLIAETPFARQSTSDGTMFKAWTDLAADASLDVSYLVVNRGKLVLRDLDLGKFDAVLLAGNGISSLRPADVQKVRRFAEAGGQVVVVANHFMTGTVDQANAVLAGYGLQMRDEEAPIGQNRVTLEKDELPVDVVRAGVNSLSFFRASPVAVTNAKAGRILAKAVGVGQPEDGFVASAKAGKGKVIALGQSLWWHWISEEQDASTDNAKLLRLLLVPGKLSEP